MNEEIKLLRVVYESARKVLREYGVNMSAFNIAIQQLDDAIEEVKLLDSGLLHFDEE